MVGESEAVNQLETSSIQFNSELSQELRSKLESEGIKPTEYQNPQSEYRYVSYLLDGALTEQEDKTNDRRLVVKPGITHTIGRQTGIAEGILKNVEGDYRQVLSGHAWLNFRSIARRPYKDGGENNSEAVDRDLLVLEEALENGGKEAPIDVYGHSQGASSMTIDMIEKLMDKGYIVENVFLDAPVSIMPVGGVGIIRMAVEANLTSISPDTEVLCPSPLTIQAAREQLEDLETMTSLTWDEKQQAAFCTEILSREGTYDIVSHDPKLQESLRSLDNSINERILSVSQTYENLAMLYMPEQEKGEEALKYSTRLKDSFVKKIDNDMNELEKLLRTRDKSLKPVMMQRFIGNYNNVHPDSVITPDQKKALLRNLFKSVSGGIAESRRLGSPATLESLRRLKVKYPNINVSVTWFEHDPLFPKEALEELSQARVNPTDQNSALLVDTVVRRMMHGHWGNLFDPEMTVKSILALRQETTTRE